MLPITQCRSSSWMQDENFVAAGTIPSSAVMCWPLKENMRPWPSGRYPANPMPPQGSAGANPTGRQDCSPELASRLMRERGGDDAPRRRQQNASCRRHQIPFREPRSAPAAMLSVVLTDDVRITRISGGCGRCSRGEGSRIREANAGRPDAPADLPGLRQEAGARDGRAPLVERARGTGCCRWPVVGRVRLPVGLHPSCCQSFFGSAP